MKFSVESDGTLAGTKMEFSMTADEIPQMVEAYQQRKSKMRLRRAQPPDVVISPDLPQMPPLRLDPTEN